MLPIQGPPALSDSALLKKLDRIRRRNPAVDALYAEFVHFVDLERPLEAVKGTRKVRKADMVHNDWQPKIEVDPETYEVRADGELLACEPAKVLPMAQRYFLF